MKKRTRMKALLILGAAAALSVTAGCSKKGGDQTSAIKKTGTLRVAITTGRSRLCWVDDSDGSYQGMEAGIGKAVADGFGLNVSYVPVESGRPLTEVLEAGEADMAIGSITDDGSLSDSFGMTTPYAYGYLCAVTSRGNFVNSIAALKDSQIGISENVSSASLLTLNEASPAGEKTYSETDGRKALENGTIEAYICYEDEAVALVKEEPIFQAQNLVDTGAEGYVSITKKENKSLLEGMEVITQAYLDALEKSGSSASSESTEE